MQLVFLLVLLIVAAAVIFALQNAAAVTMSFLAWQFDGSLALLLLMTFCLGVLASMLAWLPTLLKKNRRLREQNKTIKELQDNLVQYKDLLNPSEQVN